MNALRSLLFFLLLLQGFSAWCFGQEDLKTRHDIDSYYIDFAVPDLSAFTLLGVNANDISRPGNIKELSAAFLDRADINGKISPGIAIEWSPSLTFASRNIRDYRKNHLIRAITVSLATIKDSSATKLGFGFRWVPVDKSDPLMDKRLEKDVIGYFEKMDLAKSSAEMRRPFLKKTREFFLGLHPDTVSALAMASLIEPAGETPPPDPLEMGTVIARLMNKITELNINLTEGQRDTLQVFASEYIEIIKDDQRPITNLIKARKKVFNENKWNRAAVQIAVGTTLESENSTWKKLEADKFSTFGGAALPIARIGQWVFQAQYTRSYKDGAKEKWRYSLGSRLLLGSSKFRCSVEGLFSETRSPLREMDGNGYRATIGLEFKISEGLWAEIAVGGNFPQGDGADSEIISLGNIKYALQKERTFDIP